LPFLFTKILSLSIVNHLFFTSLSVINNARNELHNEESSAGGAPLAVQVPFKMRDDLRD